GRLERVFVERVQRRAAVDRVAHEAVNLATRRGGEVVDAARQDRLARGPGGPGPLVGDPDELVLEPERTDDLGRRRKEGRDSHATSVGRGRWAPRPPPNLARNLSTDYWAGRRNTVGIVRRMINQRTCMTMQTGHLTRMTMQLPGTRAATTFLTVPRRLLDQVPGSRCGASVRPGRCDRPRPRSARGLRRVDGRARGGLGRGAGRVHL